MYTARRVPSILQEKTPPGTWSVAVEHAWDVGATTATLVTTALMVCPTCDRAFSLKNHAIGADGVASPSVVCPHAGCEFHDFVRLEGWR